jgi:hypothetical protein
MIRFNWSAGVCTNIENIQKNPEKSLKIYLWSELNPMSQNIENIEQQQEQTTTTE